MPSAGSCSNSDVDCGSAVRYTLQCEYPERPHFGPDKFGAFFGDVELGRIVQVCIPIDASRTRGASWLIWHNCQRVCNHELSAIVVIIGIISGQSWPVLIIETSHPAFFHMCPWYMHMKY